MLQPGGLLAEYHTLPLSIMMEESSVGLNVEAATALAPLELAKERINSALINVTDKNIPLQRFPCTIFHGCDLMPIDEKSMKTIQTSFLHLCSIQGQRRWSMKSGYTVKGIKTPRCTAKVIKAYRGVCPRSGTHQHRLIHRNVRTSPKCMCKASFTIFTDGNVVFKNDHSELCLPDPDMGNDGYVFNSGLSPTRKTSIISSISDMLSDYGTTPAAARKQIENSLVRSGDTGFGSGRRAIKVICA